MEIRTRLVDPDYKIRSDAIFDIQHNLESKEQFVPELLNALEDPHELVRAYAINALADIMDERAIGPVRSRLDDESPHVRRCACEAAGKFRDPDAVNSLIRLLKDEDAAVVYEAAHSLGIIGDPVAVPDLIIQLNEQNWRAAEALGNIGDTRAIDHLLGNFQEAELQLRLQIIGALCTIEMKNPESVDISKAEEILRKYASHDEKHKSEASSYYSALMQAKAANMDKLDIPFALRPKPKAIRRSILR